MDILFYDSILSLKQSYLMTILYHLVKALMFFVFIPIDYATIKAPNDPRILAAMAIALIVSLLQSLISTGLRLSTLSNNLTLLKLSTEMNHNS